ncbi:hypothetical protein EBU58_02960 [bacterium]|nr:hypothetical protein [bacterium]
MFTVEPQPTQVDLSFRLADVPVRVSIWFWAAAALLGWSVCQALAGQDQRQLLAYLIVWMGVVFVSILIHEMGHALAYRRYGLESRVVLVHFGGITVPLAWGQRVRRPLERIVISAAGPVAQLARSLRRQAAPGKDARGGGLLFAPGERLLAAAKSVAGAAT